VKGLAGDGPLCLLGRRVAPAFELRVRVVPPGRADRVDNATWRDALVEVARGQLEVEFASGERRRFEAGEVLWLDGLPSRLLRNCGLGSAVLVAIRRRPR
jgi:hypothetical protein